MLSRTKPSAARRRLRRAIALITAVIILTAAYFEAVVRIQLTEVIRTRMRTMALAAADSAVAELIDAHPDIGERLTKLSYASDGRVSALTTDPSYINSVKAETASLTRSGLSERARDGGVSVPLGSFTGLVFLSDFGPDISLRIRCDSSASCSFSSAFESAGINQTVHHISMTVTVRVIVYDPFRIYDGMTVSSDYEIAQTVIVGSVPSYGGMVTY